MEERAWQARQQAGLTALMEIASQASFGMSATATTIIPALPAWRTETLQPPRTGPEADWPDKRGPGAPPWRLHEMAARLRTDHLVRNSLYLMLSTGIQAALGFMFWVVMARLYGAADVGRASSLISATVLIAYFALFGLNSTIVRYLPTADDPSALISGAFMLVGLSAAAIGLIYVLLTPLVAPRLAFIDRPALAAGFAAFAAAAAINLLTDSVFIAGRKASFCAVTDGVIGGLSKIVFGVVLAGAGAYGLFSASVAGFAMAAFSSLALMMMVMHWRPSVRLALQSVQPLLKFSGANYAANALNLIPSVVVPIVVLDRLGPAQAGYYFVAYQMASLLYAAIYAVEQTFLAEGSQAAADWRAIRRRSRRLAVLLFVPGGILLAAVSHWILLAFGAKYSQHGTITLVLLAIAVLPIAVCNWSWTVLRLSGRLGGLVLSTGVYAGAICGSAWILAPHGLPALSSSWFVGSSLASVVATVAASAVVSRRPAARHRRVAAPPFTARAR